MSKKKTNKTSEQIAIEIQESERIIKKSIEDSKKALVFAKRVLDTATNTFDGTKIHELEKNGKIMAENGHKLDKIMSRLRREFKEFIEPRSAIYYQLSKKHPEWVQSKFRPKSADVLDVAHQDESLTEYQKQFAEKAEAELRRDSAITKLTQEFTGLDASDQGRILGKSKTGNQTNWRKLLIEESEAHIFEMVKSMDYSELTYTINELRTLMEVCQRVRDACYQERQLREKKEDISGV